MRMLLKYELYLTMFCTTAFLQLFQSQIQALFKHITAVAYYIFMYSAHGTYGPYSIIDISLLHHIKSDVIVL